MEKPELIHWADITADRIIRTLGDKNSFVCASGITPSGVVHFGNFRETITVDFVVKALRRRGKKVRFIFSWDDYDTFRKIPANLPKQEELEKYLFQPIVDTPDPFETDESYAAHHERSYMEQLKKVGVEAEPIFQANMYRAKTYNQEILKVLKAKDKIAKILNQYRSQPLAANWLPVSIYCENCNRDKMKSIEFVKESLKYECELCSHSGSEEVATSTRLKLPWRVDWPMRWAFEKVDFEPGGKDHSSQGGSFSTAKEIVKDVFDWAPPVYVQYDFVSIKGAGGKMSSSKGNLITVNDVLKVYEPEMLRWIFASYKTNVDFSVSFDLDVIKVYEDFDRMERLAFGLDQGNEKKMKMAKRVYELSQINDEPKQCPIQPSFRHLCNILQINEGNIDKAKEFYKDQIRDERDERRFNERSACALHWLENYAPEEFKFQLNKQTPSLESPLQEPQKKFLEGLVSLMEKDWQSLESDKDLHGKLYELIHQVEVEPQDIFPVLYEILISRPKGPKLAGFMRIIGPEKIAPLVKGALL